MKKFFLLSLILLLTSCSLYNINSEEVTTNYYPSKGSPEEVVYLENVTQPHEIIGYITVNTERIQTMNEVVEKLKREAAIMGGDAITNVGTDASGTWKKLPLRKLLGNAYIRADYTATVVAYR